MIIFMWIVGIVVAIAVWLATYEVGHKCYALATERGWAKAWCVVSAVTARLATLVAGIALGGFLANY